jgi:hypothetical protein
MLRPLSAYFDLQSVSYALFLQKKIFKVRSKQTTSEYNFINYLYRYMFRPNKVIIRLTFRLYYKKYTYCIV